MAVPLLSSFYQRALLKNKGVCTNYLCSLRQLYGLIMKQKLLNLTHKTDLVLITIGKPPDATKRTPRFNVSIRNPKAFLIIKIKGPRHQYFEWQGCRQWSPPQLGSVGSVWPDVFIIFPSLAIYIIENLPGSIKICQSRYKNLPNTKPKQCQNVLRTVKILPQWQNFANLVTLVRVVDALKNR